MYRLYHNPRCSKSRTALALLEEAGTSFTVIRYLDEPPSASTLQALLAKLGVPAADVLRHNEPAFRSLGLDQLAEIDAETAIQALLKEPKLLQRPILETDDRAVIGRPPEQIRTLL
ncbi:arsenate reductase (glutaredoxin) [Spectribacter hydrogenoxidans]|uniref:Arsenate reductase n=1 Tax=Spectribacter hydrogenoxidans TaxID=3075608 RepID=A0ABU3C1V5_9GAMM|nr:arsenate reductase (glutaredoxin) [Salinisphaera sp. W335]MDT0635344.1 arsenate reductase (glutaredoxin) [Salinisphaera sp. W335]